MKRSGHKLMFGMELLEPRQLLATLFVDPVLGNDLQTTGAIDQPFKTISRAAVFAQPGDTVSLREGVYREQVNLQRSGMPNSPITFEAYGGEQALVTTTDQITGWTQHSGNVYKTFFDSGVMGRNGMTLFVDGQLMVEAHWSDKGAKVDTLVRDNFATMSSGDLNGFTDSALVGFPDDHWNGAFVWAQTTDFTMEARRISDFNGATGRVTLSTPFQRDPRSGDTYLIYDHIAALDAPGEWYFDESANTLYLWVPAGGDPDDYLVEAKVRAEAFDLNGNDYLHFEGIDFRGGDLDMSGSNGVLLQGSHIVAADRGFGPEGSGGAGSLTVDGSNNVIRDNEIERAWSTVARLDGDHNQFLNNYVHHVGYNNSNAAVVSLGANAEESLVSHNTIQDVGRAAIGGVGGLRSVIQNNDVSRIAQMTEDVGAIYLLNNSLGNSVIRYNVFHDITAHLSNGVYLDNNASDVAVHNNISYNVSAFGGKINLPNSYVLWFNNTHYSSGRIDAWGPSTSRDSSTGSKFFNNIISQLDNDLISSEDPAEASNNVFSSSDSLFVNAAAGDFRLTASSIAVDAGREIAGVTDGFAGAAPDAGALELGQEMWDFGHDFTSPPYPDYEWAPLPYMNRVENPSFDANLISWQTTNGSPSRYNGNAWNYRADALAIAGVGALEVDPGEQIEQVVTGLLPNTTYTISAFARMVNDLQIEDYDGSSGSFTNGNHRGENYLGSVNAGEWVRFDEVDFGSGTPLYDRVEIGTQQNSSLSVQLRLDSPAGQLIGTLNVPSRGEPWFMTREDITAVTGIHDLYVVFQGSGGSIGKFDRIRLLNTNILERVTLGVKDFDQNSSTVTSAIGGAYWASAPESLNFTTGPTASTATIFVSKQGGKFSGYVDQVAFTGDAFQAATPTRLELFVDPSTGSTVLQNNTNKDVSFDGYRITDSAESLVVNEWFSLEDQVFDNGDWYEAGPSATHLAELKFAGIATLIPGSSVYLGELVDPAVASNLAFEYYRSDIDTLRTGHVRFEGLDLPALMADYNGDSQVNAADYTVYRDSLGMSVAPFTGADGNGNGAVDRADYLLWRRNFGNTIASSLLRQSLDSYDDPVDIASVNASETDAALSELSQLLFPASSSDVGTDRRTLLSRPSNIVLTPDLDPLLLLLSKDHAQQSSDSSTQVAGIGEQEHQLFEGKQTVFSVQQLIEPIESINDD